MRRLLMLLLCCTLATQGMVQAWAAGATRCPHEAAGVPMAAAGDPRSDTAHAAPIADAADEDDCCNDLAAQLRTGKLCKALFDCQPSAPALLALPGFVPGPAPGGAPAARAEHISLPFAAAVIWRPPAVS